MWGLLVLALVVHLMTVLSDVFCSHMVAFVATPDGLTAPDDAADGHMLSIYGPCAQAKRFDPLAKVPKLLRGAHVWLAGA